MHCKETITVIYCIFIFSQTQKTVRFCQIVNKISIGLLLIFFTFTFLYYSQYFTKLSGSPISGF